MKKLWHRIVMACSPGARPDKVLNVAGCIIGGAAGVIIVAPLLYYWCFVFSIIALVGIIASFIYRDTLGHLPVYLIKGRTHALYERVISAFIDGPDYYEKPLFASVWFGWHAMLFTGGCAAVLCCWYWLILLAGIVYWLCWMSPVFFIVIGGLMYDFAGLFRKKKRYIRWSDPREQARCADDYLY